MGLRGRQDGVDTAPSAHIEDPVRRPYLFKNGLTKIPRHALDGMDLGRDDELAAQI